MKVRFKKTFLKDLDRLPVDMKNRVQELVFNTIPQTEGLELVGKVKKIKGHDSYYRIKMGDYRIGIKMLDNDTLIFFRVLHRKDIYRFFP